MNQIKTTYLELCKWLFPVAGILSVLLIIYAYILTNELYEERTKLTIFDSKIQEFNKELGLSRSQLVSASQLNDELKSHVSFLDNDLRRLIESYKLKPKSYSNTVVKVDNTAKTGETKTVVVDKITSYVWEDEYKRFKLVDEDINIPGNEIFTYSQYFTIEATVFEGKAGQLQTQHIQLKEVVLDKDKFKELNTNTELVDSNFKYVNNPRIPKLLDILTLRPYVSFDTTRLPGLGLELINIGQYFPYVNAGLGPKFSFNYQNPISSRLGLDFIYHISPPVLNTNIGISANVGVPINNLLSPVFSFSLVFYLTEPWAWK